MIFKWLNKVFPKLFWPIYPRTHARDIVSNARNITRVLKGNPTKTINMALVRKFFPLISRASIFKRTECSSTLLRVDKSSCLGTLVFYHQSQENCVFFLIDNTDLSNTSGHAISSEQRNNYKSTCSLPSFG